MIGAMGLGSKRRFTNMLKENYPMDYMLKFMDNLYSNVTRLSVNSLTS